MIPVFLCRLGTSWLSRCLRLKLKGWYFPLLGQKRTYMTPWTSWTLKSTFGSSVEKERMIWAELAGQLPESIWCGECRKGFTLLFLLSPMVDKELVWSQKTAFASWFGTFRGAILGTLFYLSWPLFWNLKFWKGTLPLIYNMGLEWALDFAGCACLINDSMYNFYLWKERTELGNLWYLQKLY